MADIEEEPTVQETLQVEEASEAKGVKLFGRWTFDDVDMTRDISLTVSFLATLLT